MIIPNYDGVRRGRENLHGAESVSTWEDAREIRTKSLFSQ
jgi:hypothetical protein